MDNVLNEKSRSVVLPHGARIELSHDPATWPMRPNTIGYVPRYALAPDPEQPRRYFDPEELKNLAATIRENGQRDLIVVRVLTSQELAARKHPLKARYEIVSGERRWRATGVEYANIPYVEIRVREYKDRGEQHEDAYLLNDSRQNLSHIETARGLLRMLNERCDGRISRLRERTGKSQGYIDQHLLLTKLSPAVQELMNPLRPDHQQLGFAPAQALARFALPAEDELHYAEGMISLRRSSSVQVRWLEQQLGRSVRSPGTKRGEAWYRLRDMIVGASDAFFMRTSVLVQLAGKDLQRALAHLGSEELGLLIKRLKTAHAHLGTFIGNLERMRGGSEMNGTSAANVRAVLPDWLEIEYWNIRDARYEKLAVSPTRYRELSKANLLRYQRENKPRPAHLPDPIHAR